MTLQQIRYILAIAESRSVSLAAKRLFISQPSLSAALKEVEDEFGIRIFNRGRECSRTREGEEFLIYARQVMDQMNLLENRFSSRKDIRELCSVSAQHYIFAVKACSGLVKRLSFSEYEVTFRETRTYEIISDVAQMRSEIGLLYENGFNRKIIGKLLKENHLSFTPLFRATPHVFVSRDHPLAGRKEVTLEDLEPYPCLSFEQGQYNSFYFSEEILSELPHARSIHVSDRATLFNFLVGLSGYTISSGFLSEELNGGDIIVSVRLRVDDEMHIGYIRRKSGELSRFAGLYIEELRKVIKEAGYEPEEEAPAPPAMD